MAVADQPVGTGVRLMLPEQLAFKRKAERNMERLREEKRTMKPDPERNKKGIAAARQALKRRK